MSTETKRLFISHSSQDKGFVNRLVSRLKEAGVADVWYDAFDVGPTEEDLHQRFQEGIAASDYFAIVLSPAAQSSQWVSYEIQQAKAQSKPVLPLVVDAPQGHYDFLRNPHLNELLRGGRHRVIDFSGEFEKGLTQLLLEVAPDEGQRRTVAETLRDILRAPDPDAAERAMSFAGLDPDAYLPELMALLPARQDPILAHRLARAMTHMGEKALPALFGYLLRTEDVSSAEIPERIPHEYDEDSGTAMYTGDSFLDVLRHLILTGGDRAWAAQNSAQRCLVAIAESSPALRSTIQAWLNDFLGAAVQTITAHKHSASFREEFYDALRVAIETAGLVADPRSPPDPWLIQQFATTGLWGAGTAGYAKEKLTSYVVACLSRIGSRPALESLLDLADDPDISELYFKRARAPNPWDDCFTRFGHMAADALLARLDDASDAFRPFVLGNLAQLPNGRALRAVLEVVQAPQAAADRHALLLRAAGTGVPDICDLILERFVGHQLLPDGDPTREHLLERAVARAARHAKDRKLAERVCVQLSGSEDVWAITHLIEAFSAQRIYSLVSFVRSQLEESRWPGIRGMAAVSLSKVREIDADEVLRRLQDAEEETERPYLSVALANLGRVEAIPGLVDGLQHSFKTKNWVEHTIYAEALTQLGTDEAQQLRRKWERRI